MLTNYQNSIPTETNSSLTQINNQISVARWTAAYVIKPILRFYIPKVAWLAEKMVNVVSAMIHYADSYLPANPILSAQALPIAEHHNEDDKPDDHLIPFDFTDIRPAGDYSLFLVRDEKDIANLQANVDPLQLDGSHFKNTPLHVFIANHFYKVIIPSLNHFPEHRDKMLVAKDVKGNTPLLLAMQIGAPPSLICAMMTRENVVMAGDDGVIPLMMAVRGMHTSVIEKLFSLMDDKTIEQQLSKKDNAGRTVEQWNTADKEFLKKDFLKVEVNPGKSCTYPFNVFFSGQEIIKSFTFSSIEYGKKRLSDLGLETASTYFNDGKEYIGVLATLENAKKIHDAITANDEAGKKSLNELKVAISKILPKLSNQSLVDLYLSRQESCWKVIVQKREELKESTHYTDMIQQRRQQAKHIEL